MLSNFMTGLNYLDKKMSLYPPTLLVVFCLLYWSVSVYDVLTGLFSVPAVQYGEAITGETDW